MRTGTASPTPARARTLAAAPGWPSARTKPPPPLPFHRVGGAPPGRSQATAPAKDSRDCSVTVSSPVSPGRRLYLCPPLGDPAILLHRHLQPAPCPPLPLDLHRRRSGCMMRHELTPGTTRSRHKGVPPEELHRRTSMALTKKVEVASAVTACRCSAARLGHLLSEHAACQKLTACFDLFGRAHQSQVGDGAPRSGARPNCTSMAKRSK